MSHLQRIFFKYAGITVSHFLSMLQSTLKYLYSVEPVRMHFPAKQPCTNDVPLTKIFQVLWDSSIPLSLHAVIYLEVSLFRWTSQNAFSHETTVYKWYCVQFLLEKPLCKWNIYVPLVTKLVRRNTTYYNASHYTLSSTSFYPFLLIHSKVKVVDVRVAVDAKRRILIPKARSKHSIIQKVFFLFITIELRAKLCRQMWRNSLSHITQSPTVLHIKLK
jgi:hypothetical protein